MTMARGFARYLAGIDARTEVPPPGLIADRRRWRPPFIYSPGDIEALMAQARQLKPMPVATRAMLIGLLAVKGMRVAEAIRLDRTDIDWTDAVLMIRESKFGKTRMVPVLDSTLGRYAGVRDRLCPAGQAWRHRRGRREPPTASLGLAASTRTALCWPRIQAANSSIY
jgi:integrase